MKLKNVCNKNKFYLFFLQATKKKHELYLKRNFFVIKMSYKFEQTVIQVLKRYDNTLKIILNDIEDLQNSGKFGLTGYTGYTGPIGPIGLQGQTGPTGSFGGFVEQNIIPLEGTDIDIGDEISGFNNIYISDSLIPTSNEVRIGTETNPIKNLLVSESISIGSNSITTLDDSLILPNNTKVVDIDLYEKINDLQNQISTLKTRLDQVCQLWNSDLFDEHIVDDMIS
jgi:hypothetical protein